MGAIDFLGLDDVVEIHHDQIERYGGSDGIRDAHLLESAVAAPQATFDERFLHGDLFSMAAAYLFHITQNHPFVDGNKRTGAVAALVFFALNEVEIQASEEEIEGLVRRVATGKADTDAVAAFFRSHQQDSGDRAG